jgi:AraC-like DNA-binding protein
LVRTSSVRPLYDWLDRNGVPDSRPLRDGRRLATNPNAVMPIVLAGRLFAEAARQSATSEIGLLASEATPLLQMGAWGAALARASNVGEVLDAAILATQRFNTAQEFWITRRGGETTVHLRYAPCLVEGRTAVEEYALVKILQGLRLGAGAAWRPGEIHLSTPRPAHARRIEALAEGRVRWEQPHAAIVLATEVLDAPVAAASPPAPNALEAVDPARDFPGSVRQLVASLVDLGSADLRSAAAALRLSERSLQRRLGAAGLHFKALVEQARFEKARRMLAERERKIVEISTELGYGDSANFTRAFRRWTGVAPQTYRRETLGGAAAHGA